MTTVEEMSPFDLLGMDDDEPPPPDDTAPEEGRDLAWVMIMSHRLSAIRRKQRRISDAAQAELDRIGEWAAEKDRPLAEAAAAIEAALRDYMLRERERTGGKVKSLDTPWVELSSTLTGGGWTASDETVEWALSAAPDIVKVTRKVDLQKLKGIHGLTVVDGTVVDTETGEPVPGVTVAPKTVAATVKLKGDES